MNNPKEGSQGNNHSRCLRDVFCTCWIPPCLSHVLSACQLDSKLSYRVLSVSTWKFVWLISGATVAFLTVRWQTSDFYIWLCWVTLLSVYRVHCPLSTVFGLENNRGNSTRATLTVGKTPAELNAVFDGSPLLVERYTEFLDSKIHTRVPICRRRYCWSATWWLFVDVSFLVNI